MGTGSSAPKETLYPTNDYKKIEKPVLVHDKRYGEIYVIEEASTMNRAAVQTVQVQDQETLAARETEIQELQKLDHASLVKIINSNQLSKKGMCSNTFQVDLLFEYLDQDLSQQNKERIRLNCPYDQTELWYMLHSVVSGLQYLKLKDRTHQDIRPYSLLLSTDGKIKLLPKPIFSPAMNSYTELLLGIYPDESLYLSPKLF